MTYAYVARISMAAATGPGWYVLKFVDIKLVCLTEKADRSAVLTLADAAPPAHRRRSDGSFTWDYAHKPIRAREFHRLYPHIRLKPGEGPILVDLEHTTQNRTSRHPDDT